MILSFSNMIPDLSLPLFCCEGFSRLLLTHTLRPFTPKCRHIPAHHSSPPLSPLSVFALVEQISARPGAGHIMTFWMR